MSLSKLGLPAVRTGIVIAREEVVSAISAMNAVVSLSSGSIGQAVILPFIESGQILQISREIITPFYYNKSQQTVRLLKEAFGKNVDYAIHKSEGAFFLWIWFRNLPISTGQLYERLKNRSVLVIPGCYFFYGLEETWSHRDECIRLNYSQNDEDVERGVEILADEVGNLV
jgi:valine--pyruvate aminotransferase